MTVSLQLPSSLTLVGAAPAPVAIAPGAETTVRFRLRAGAALGAAAVVVRAQFGHAFGATAHRAVAATRQRRAPGPACRPCAAARHPGKAARDVRAALDAATGRLGVAAGGDRRAHRLPAATTRTCAPSNCSARRCRRWCMPRGRSWDTRWIAAPAIAATCSTCCARARTPKAASACGSATPDADPFVSVYAALYLVESRERGIAGARRHAGLAQPLSGNPGGRSRRAPTCLTLRQRAMAVYLLVRQGRTASNLLGRGAGAAQARPAQGLAGRCRRHADRGQLPAAATGQARARAGGQGTGARECRPSRRCSTMATTTTRHRAGVDACTCCSDTSRRLRGRSSRSHWRACSRRLRSDRYNTLSSALTVLALDAHAGHAGGPAMPTLQAAGPEGQGAADRQAARRGRRVGNVHRRRHAPVGHPGRRSAGLVPAHADRAIDRKPPPAAQGQGLEVHARLPRRQRASRSRR